MFFFEYELAKVIELLEKFKVYAIYLFGSAVKNQLRNDSDIDIAFITDEDIDEYETFMKAQELAYVFKRNCDLIDLKKSSTVFKMQVIGRGKAIYCTDEIKRAYFEMKSFKEYAILNEERAEVLKSIEKSGSIYDKRFSLQ